MSSTWPNIPGYVLEREIGRGGMGVVYLAQRISDGLRVALKVVQLSPEAEPDYRHRLRGEARRAAAVRHPGIVRVLDDGARADLVWLAMDLVEGPDLQRLIDDGGPLDAGLAAEIVAQTADAASAAHAAGLVHGDIKPANILLEPRPGESAEADLEFGAPRARLSDFGVARPFTADRSVGLSDASDWARTTHGSGAGPDARAGTLAYMAPEQWSGDQVDQRTDVYALGATLHTALTARRPFPQVSLPELAYAVALTPPPAPTDSREAVPAAFDTVVATAMAKDPANRYRNAATLAEAVRAAARGRRMPTPARRRRSLLTAGSAVLVAATAGIGLTLWSPWSTHDDGDSGKRVVVCARDMTLRDRPGGATTHTLVGGDRVTIQHTQGAWSYVSADDGARGWALRQYMQASC